MDPDPDVHARAAEEWCRWEDAHVAIDVVAPVDGFIDERYSDPTFRVALARQVTHCWAADSWLPPNELVAGAAGMTGVPCILVHGRRDRSSPLATVEGLHESWPGSRLIVTDDGHGGIAMWRCVAAALSELAST
jgi:proline iminopeptidase